MSPFVIDSLCRRESNNGKSVGVDPAHIAGMRWVALDFSGRVILDALQQWMTVKRHKLPDSSATAKALDYSLRRWTALTRFVDDGQLPVDNNWIENQIRPIAVGGKNWLFAGSLRAGQRAAAVMSLVQSARMNGHDPYAYLKDVLTRLPTHSKRPAVPC